MSKVNKFASNKVKVSIIIVNFKSKKFLLNCLESVKSSRPKISYEVIVVDNDEKKGIKRQLSIRFPWVRYVPSPSNRGYGAGNNLGAREALGKYLLILNPDTKVLKGAIDELVGFLDKNKKAAIVAPNLLDENFRVFSQLGSRTLTPIRGIVALSFLNKIFPRNWISTKYWLKDLSLSKKREVDVVPGSAFMIRKEVFDLVGGYDENFFLYFEESDLGKRVRELGWKVFIIPQAQIVHYWTIKGDSLSKNIFAESRFYYFRKHYGILWAIIVEVFANFSKWHVMLLVVVTLAAFLRFFRINENLVFHGELGYNYLTIKNFILNRQIPLLGPATSHPWLSFGPLFYWVFSPILVLANFNPNSGAYFFAAVGVIGILINFFVVQKLLGKKIAIISSYLLAISPIWLSLTRESRFFSLVVYLFYPFLYFFFRLLKDQKYLFWLGLTLGIMLNFHLTPIFLIPPALIILYKRYFNLRKRYIFQGLIGFLIPNIPFLIYNIRTHFVSLTKFIIWIPYRTIIYKNFGLGFTLGEIYKFLGILGFISLIFVFLKFRKEKIVSVLLMFLFFGILALILHKDPPSHYFYVLYPIPIIFLAIFLSKLKPNLLFFSILFLITFVNLKFLFSNKWFFTPEDIISPDGLVPYKLQVAVSKAIINDARGEKFNLKRAGLNDQFSQNYSQNYRYLMWWMGNEPVDEKQSLSYTIVESAPNVTFEKSEK